MIKLTKLLFEIIQRRSTRSWLSPSGIFFATVDDDGNIVSHETTAIDILDYLKTHAEDKDIINETASSILFKSGYHRIVMGSQGQYLPHVLICNNPFKKPNRKQMSELIDLAIENQINTIMYDDGTSKGYVKNVIWSNTDI